MYIERIGQFHQKWNNLLRFSKFKTQLYIEPGIYKSLNIIIRYTMFYFKYINLFIQKIYLMYINQRLVK